MAQVLDRVKTFFIEMTKGDIAVSNNGIDLEKQVKAIEAQQTRNLGEIEKEVENVYIPLEEETTGFVKRAKVNEREADETARRKQGIKQSKEKQRGE